MEITSINDLDNDLKKYQGSLRELYLISSQLTKLLHNCSNKDEKKLIKAELYVFDFAIADGKATPKNYGIDKKGRKVGYPSFNSLDDEDMSYLVKRADAVKNIWLVIRYNTVVWSSRKTKHIRFAKKAIDASYDLLTQKKFYRKVHRIEVLPYFKNVCALSMTVNYRKDDFVELWGKWIFKRSIIPKERKFSYIEYALDSKLLKVQHFSGVSELCLSIANRINAQNNHYLKQEILSTALKVAIRTKSDTLKIKKAIAKNYVETAKDNDNESPQSKFIPIGFYAKALGVYQELKNDKKIDEIATIIVKLRNELELAKVDVKLDSAETMDFVEYLRKKVNYILNNNKADDIFTFLANGSDRDIFPDQAWVLEAAAKKGSGSFMDHINKSLIDINNNQRAGAKDEEGKLEEKVYEHYGWYINFSLIRFLHFLFFEGIKKQKLTFEAFISYVQNRSWIGENVEERRGGGDLITHNWLILIAPSMIEFFIQIEATIKDRNYRPDLILALDSLTLKFEGILKTFAQLNGVRTIRYSNRHDGIRELTIEKILEHKKMQKLFDRNDQLLFNYILYEEGLNIRNKVAHSFYRYDDYSLDKMYLIIIAILRLGKYSRG